MLNVLLIAYDRPDLVQMQVEIIKRISRQRPLGVFAAVDGPKTSDNADAVAQTIQILSSSDIIDDTRMRLSPRNLGCGRGVSTAISWFFSRVEDGIILEDDCLACSEFFDFAEWGLERFRDVTSVGMISGYTPVPARLRTQHKPAYLSRYPQIWGWAGWRRTWENFTLRTHYDPKSLRASGQWESLGKIERATWSKHFRSCFGSERVDNWDVQFVYKLWKANQFAVLPHVPLVDNRGFASSATHTSNGVPEWYQPIANEVERKGLVAALSPAQMPASDSIGDAWMSRNLYSPPLLSRAATRLFK